MLQLHNISDAVTLKLENIEAVLRLHLCQTLQGCDAVAGEHKHLQLTQRLKTVRVLQPVCTQVEIRQLRAGIEVVNTLQSVAADV